MLGFIFRFSFSLSETNVLLLDFAFIPLHTLTGIIAGVREGVGNEGLQRLMGEKSEAVTSRVGGLICRTFGGFRVFPEL